MRRTRRSDGERRSRDAGGARGADVGRGDETPDEGRLVDRDRRRRLRHLKVQPATSGRQGHLALRRPGRNGGFARKSAQKISDIKIIFF